MSHQPADAFRLVLDPARIRAACDLSLHPIHRHGSVRSLGWGRESVVQLAQRLSHQELTRFITQQLQLPVQEWCRSREPLRITTINRPGDQPRWAPDATQEELSAWGAKERDICIPSPVQRIFYYLFAAALQETSSHLLSQSCMAYRPGRQDPVRQTIIRVAGHVRSFSKGAEECWVASVDIRQAFPSMPWVQLRRALGGLGYQEDFIDRLMGLVRVPLARDGEGPKKQHQGCPAGLSISGTLLNILLTDLDRSIESKFGRWVRYSRYADDIQLVSGSRHQLVGAWRAIRRWVEQHGMQLKGVGPSSSAHDHVHLMADGPWTLLGCCIDRDGEVTPEPSRAEGTRQWVAYQARHLRVGAVAGTPGCGLAAFDARDVVDTVAATYRYWRPLTGAAESFSSSLWAEVDGSRLGLAVWHCCFAAGHPRGPSSKEGTMGSLGAEGPGGTGHDLDPVPGDPQVDPLGGFAADVGPQGGSLALGLDPCPLPHVVQQGGFPAGAGPHGAWGMGS